MRTLIDYLRVGVYVIGRVTKFVWMALGAYVSVFAAIMIAFSFAAFFMLIKVYGYGVYIYSIQVLGTHSTQLIIALIVIASGLIAHLFKQRNQIWYGTVEMIFGSVSSLAISANLSSGSTILGPLSSLIGCAYVIARGLNNISDGRIKRDAKFREQSLLDRKEWLARFDSRTPAATPDA